MARKAIILLIILITIAFIVYRILGGSQDLAYEIEELPAMKIAGHDYKGRPGSPDVKKWFMRARDISSFSEGDRLVLISYGTEQEMDTLRQFIGSEDISYAAHDSVMVRSMDAARYVSVELNMNALVRPAPGKIRKDAQDFAQGHGEDIADWNIEIYLSETDLLILFPLVEN